MSQLRKDERMSEHKFADEIEQATKTNKMWKAVVRKAGWMENSVPTTIKSGLNVVTSMKGIADTINTYYRDKIDILISIILPTNYELTVALQKRNV